MKIPPNESFLIALLPILVLAFVGQAISDALSADAPGIGKSVSDGLIFSEAQMSVRITIKSGNNATVFELNDSQASKDLLAQLPLRIKVEDYSDNEKIFYPPKKLGVAGTPLADAKTGTLAYYAPWGDVAVFYRNFGSATGLYELGHVVSGGENLSAMSGIIEIDIALSR